MFYIIDNEWYLSSSCEKEVHSEWLNTIEKDFSKEEEEQLLTWAKFINWKIDIDTKRYKDNFLEKSLSKIESQMKKLNSNRKDLQELIDIWLDSPWDKKTVELIMIDLKRLAEQRKSFLK